MNISTDCIVSVFIVIAILGLASLAGYLVFRQHKKKAQFEAMLQWLLIAQKRISKKLRKSAKGEMTMNTEPIVKEIVYDEDGSFEFMEISPTPDKRLLHFDNCDCFFCVKSRANRLKRKQTK